MNLLIFLLASARAEETAQADQAPLQVDPTGDGVLLEPIIEEPLVVVPLTLEEVWAEQDPTEVLTQAVAFQEIGNRDAAMLRLRFLESSAPSAAVSFQIGKTLELMEDYDGSLSYYEAVLDDGDSEHAHNAAFRRIIVLEDVGRHTDSIAAVNALQGEGDWSEVDEVTLSLARGISELSSGKRRKGIKRIEAGLAVLEPTAESPWMRARARAALTETMLEEAAGLELVGNKKAARRLATRGSLMVAAEKQVIAIARLGEPEYALAGLVLLGDAYIMLHDDILTAPPPRRLSDDEVVIYRAEVEGRVAILSAKAKNYYGVN